ncbi:MAG: diversity-generating retroelement protein Avd [Synergistaceae bacterium]|jgi:four helix bundle protein|nr:diversity-generating retroelement protein Avd [Synergistaceae bacterium]
MEELLIKKKCVDMMVYAYQAMTHYPKHERFTLCADIKRSMTRVLELITRAGLSSKNQLQLLFDLDVELKVLLEFVRLSFTLKYLPTKKYEEWSTKIVELGRMCGGMIKHARQSRT